MNLTEDFKNAISYEDYINLLGESLEMHQHHYKKFQVTPELSSRISALKPSKILVITEPWCGDSLAIFPVIKKIAETNGSWDIKVAPRDENLELIDRFLTRGGRAVPIFLFLDSENSLILKWGPRPKDIQQIFEDHRAQIQAGEIEKIEVIKKIRNFYSRDRGKTICLDLLTALENNTI